MAYLRESNQNQPFLRAPAAVLWLIAVLIGAHALRVLVFKNDSDALFVTYGFVPARYSYNYLASHGLNPGTALERALPFITYMFLHGGWAHVLINSVWLLAFGPIVARRFGWLLFLGFFLVCGIAGAAAHLACNWGSTAPVIGASAAISGLMAAGFRMLPLAPRTGRTPLAPVLSPRILLWTALWVLVNVIAGVTGLGTGGEVQLVAWQAHLGGYAAGLLLAGPFDGLARPKVYSVPGA
ncbi:MAG TPA: rhomboid family intramembrane serine protease [Rhizomicrobium sp.]|nr:rhomboid family intramembrane serine protease [Rhizomicrobium sp.]